VAGATLLRDGPAPTPTALGAGARVRGGARAHAASHPAAATPGWFDTPSGAGETVRLIGELEPISEGRARHSVHLPAAKQTDAGQRGSTTGFDGPQGTAGPTHRFMGSKDGPFAAHGDHEPVPPAFQPACRPGGRRYTRFMGSRLGPAAMVCDHERSRHVCSPGFSRFVERTKARTTNKARFAGWLAARVRPVRSPGPRDPIVA